MSATMQGDGASSELAFFGQSTNSTGFGDDIVSGATLGLGSGDVYPELMSDVSQGTRGSFGFNLVSQHVWPVLPEDSDISKMRRPPSPEPQKDLSQEDACGKKRRHEPESQPVARKAPKAMKGADAKSILHRGETGAQKGPQKRKSLRRDSSLSSFSVSESDNSDDTSSSSSEEEEEEEEEEAEDTFMDTSAPTKPHPDPTAAIKVEDTSVLSQHNPHQYPHQQQQQQSDRGGMVSGGQPQGALVVRIPLVLVQNQQLHKPKVGLSAWLGLGAEVKGWSQILLPLKHCVIFDFFNSCVIRFSSGFQ